MKTSYEIAIVGAGPAGLSAALILGRSCRSVLICDSGKPRNQATRVLHGFLTRDGITPQDFLNTAQQDMAAYPNVEFVHDKVESLSGKKGNFVLRFDHETVKAERVLLAPGIEDMLLPIEGFDQYYGRSIFHCPYCDGWEARDQCIAVYGKGKTGLEFALTMRQWSKNLHLCTDGYPLSRKQKALLKSLGISFYDQPIQRLSGDDNLKEIIFWNGTTLSCSYLFFTAGQKLHDELARDLGCRITEKTFIRVNKEKETTIPGVYAAGDCTRDVHLAIVAAGEGAKAAFFINKSLFKPVRMLE